MCDILIIGCGSLGRAIAYALSSLPNMEASLLLASRDLSSACHSAAVVNMRAKLLGARVTADAAALHWDRPGFLHELIGRNRPKLIIHTASYQSPWELGRPDSHWATLVRDAGFGITLPLQAHLALIVAKAINESEHKPILMNACYPDAVNPAICASGFQVFCGLGNIAILVSMLQMESDDKLSMLAHHYHLSALLRGSPDLPKVWNNGCLVDISAEQFQFVYALGSQEINHVTACTALPLIRSCLHGLTVRTHVPGPNGLPGGYPVSIQNGNLRLELPSGLEPSEAIRWNMEAGQKDGIDVQQDGHVRFSGRASCALRKVTAQFSDSFHINDLPSVTGELLTLRDVLRQR
jgi:hypothetical protein